MLQFWKRGSWCVVVVAVLLAACGGCEDTESANNGEADMAADVGGEVGPDAGADMGEVPEFTWSVDDSVQPWTAQLHPMEVGGDPRPLSAIGGDETPTATFVSNELVVFSEDVDAVEGFVDQIGGEIVLTEDPEDAGVDAPPMHLVRVTAPALDDERFVQDLRDIAEQDEDDYAVTGDFTFSDQAGANLIALAARSAMDDGQHDGRSAMDDGQHGDGKVLQVGVNWVGIPAAIPASTEESEDPGNPGTYRSAYNFSWFGRDWGMKTGVTAAWNLLYHAGRLDNRVRIAILDMGFHLTDDLQNVSSTTVWPGFGPLDRENGYGCSGGNPCPWHGTDVAGAAMGVPDNQFGSAGSAGPIGDPILVYTTYDYLMSITAVYRARNRGARVVNMSYSAGVPWWLKWTTAGFRDATDRVRDSGVLLFAAAGNDGDNVDSEKCIGRYCWERTFHTPCENPGVHCVGGLDNPNQKADDSNYGEGSVDLWGPWCVDVGPNPDENDYHQACGTSIASPFVAGVAALVWAANPSYSASDVMNAIYNTAGGYRDKKVNAYQAVLTAIGSLMEVSIVDPADGAERYLGIPTTVTVDTTLISSPGPDADVQVTLLSSLDGEIGQQTVAVERTEGDIHTARAFFPHDFSEGIHELNVIAQYPQSMGLPTLISQDESTFLVSNPGPTVSIESPLPGEKFCDGQTVVFRAAADDLNQSLPDEAYEWLSAVDSNPYPIFFLLGSGPVITTDVLPNAEQRVTVAVTDDGGQVSSDFVDIEVVPTSDPLCSDRPPQVVISSPSDGTVQMAEGSDGNGAYLDLSLQATVTDYEDDDSTLQVEWYSDIEGQIGTGKSTTGRIYLHDPCSTKHTIRARTEDSDGNVDEDTIEVSVYVVC